MAPASTWTCFFFNCSRLCLVNACIIGQLAVIEKSHVSRLLGFMWSARALTYPNSGNVLCLPTPVCPRALDTRTCSERTRATKCVWVLCERFKASSISGCRCSLSGKLPLLIAFTCGIFCSHDLTSHLLRFFFFLAQCYINYNYKCKWFSKWGKIPQPYSRIHPPPKTWNSNVYPDCWVNFTPFCNM